MKAHVKNERKMAQLFRFMGLAHCLTCQEKAPWDEYYTYLPICTIFICCVLRFIFNGKHYRPSYDWKKMLCGLLCMLIATYFFVIGLDERNDYIEIPHSKSNRNLKVWRINHGLWHVFVSIAFFFFYYAKREFHKEKKE
jgi:predicted membrane channel-forming protein YqfA (hemolysin III family)